MAVILALKKDPFQVKSQSRAQRVRETTRYGLPKDFSHVRRPFRGIVLKADTYATLEVYEADGTPVPLINAGAREPLEQLQSLYEGELFQHQIALQRGEQVANDFIAGVDKSERGVAGQRKREADLQKRTSAIASKGTIRPAAKLVAAGTLNDYKEKSKKNSLSTNLSNFVAGQGYSLRYSNFVLQSAQETRQEKYQIMETFGIPFIFFFGERPRIYNFSGMFINSLDFNWRSEFWANYDQVLRGTRLVERNARVVLSWDDIIVEGYILQAAAQENSMQPHLINFNFQMFITSYQTTSFLGDTKFPTPSAVSIDTSVWRESVTAQARSENPSPTNVDLARRKNLEVAAQAKSPGLWGYVANGLAIANKYATLATDGIENITKQIETISSGRDVRFPIGAFPLLDELRTNDQINKILTAPTVANFNERAEQILPLISKETRRLIESGADDPFGNPQIFVQDGSLITSLTNKFNKQAFRRIKILPPGGVFTPPSNKHHVGGLIRHNTDEYVQSTIVQTSMAKIPPVKKFNRAQHTNDVILQMIKKFKSYGVDISKSDMEGLELKRKAASGVFRTGMVAGGYSYQRVIQEADKSVRADPADVDEAQKSATIAGQKNTPSSGPKFDKDSLPTGSKQEITVITPESVVVKPRILQLTPNTPTKGQPLQDKDAIRQLLKKSRQANARST